MDWIHIEDPAIICMSLIEYHAADMRIYLQSQPIKLGYSVTYIVASGCVKVYTLNVPTQHDQSVFRKYRSEH